MSKTYCDWGRWCSKKRVIQTQHLQARDVTPFDQVYGGAAARTSSSRHCWVTRCRPTMYVNVWQRQPTNLSINWCFCCQYGRGNLRTRKMGLVSVVCVRRMWRNRVWGSVLYLQRRKDMTSDDVVAKATFASGKTAVDASVHGRPGSFEVVWDYSQGVQLRPQ